MYFGKQILSFGLKYWLYITFSSLCTTIYMYHIYKCRTWIDFSSSERKPRI